MYFHYQLTNVADPTERTLARQLSKDFEELDFNSPKHLMETFTDHSKRNKLDLVVSQHNGIVNVHGQSGILLRCRSLA